MKLGKGVTFDFFLGIYGQGPGKLGRAENGASICGAGLLSC